MMMNSFIFEYAPEAFDRCIIKWGIYSARPRLLIELRLRMRPENWSEWEITGGVEF